MLTKKTHDVRLLPHYLFDRADVIVSFGADFLGTWISPVEFTAAWSKRRKPTEKKPEMSWHVQLESRMSITGSKADARHRIRPEDQAVLLKHLEQKIAMHAGENVTDDDLTHTAIPEKALTEIADKLWHAKGKSLVVSDSQDIAVQQLVNSLNHLLGKLWENNRHQNPKSSKAGKRS